LITPTGALVTTLSVPGEGTWQVNTTTGAITFSPLASLRAQPSPVSYQVADADGEFKTARVSIEFVLPDDAAPEVLLAASAPPQHTLRTGESPIPSSVFSRASGQADGAVVAAVRGISNLNGLPDISADGAVLKAVEGVQPLGGARTSIGADGYVLHVVRQIDHIVQNDRTARSDVAARINWQPNDLRGHSLRLDVARPDTPAPTTSLSGSSIEQLVIETVMSEQRLYLELKYEVERTRSDRAAEYGGSLLDGAPLPTWINLDPQSGLLIAEVPVGYESFELRLWTILDDGKRIERFVEIDGITGEVTERDTQRAATLTFSEQLLRETQERHGQLDELEAALGH
ncbi:MAG: hypothetical protein K0U93_01395, partial [Gammaproteobacteria bacterium]|nr:hypothetical protein [Gammaproteobacteria bacterium]